MMRASGRGMRALAVLIASFPALGQVTHTGPLPDVAASPPWITGLAAFTTEASAGLEERSAFAQLLDGKHFDWFVAPVQIQARGFDRAERSLMSLAMVTALSDRGTTLPSAFVVERAMGDGQRHISLDDVDALSRRVGATKILVPYVGHDGSRNLLLTVAIYQKPSVSGSIESVVPQFLTTAKRAFSPTRPPIEAFNDALTELYQPLGLPAQGRPPSAPAPDNKTVPTSPETLAIAGSDDPLTAAARLAVLGELAPPWTRAAERLFEKSLLAANRAPHGEARIFFQACALYRLNLRLAAIQLLNGELSTGLRALAAILNGNLTGTKVLVEHTAGYQRVILELELHDLARTYLQVNRQERLPVPLQTLAAESESWRTLLWRRWDFGKEWSGQSNTVLKQMLDKTFPVTGHSLESMVAAQAATPGRGISGTELELSVRDHIRHLMADQRDKWCCSGAVYQPEPWDFLTIVESWSDENLMQAVDTELNMRGSPESAKKQLNALTPYYDGRPSFEVRQAAVDNALRRKSPETLQGAYRRSAREHALRALHAAGGQTYDAINALGELDPDPLTVASAQAYGQDYPLNPAWLGNDYVIDPTQRLSLAKEALANTQTGVGYVSYMLLDQGETAKPEALRAIGRRFLGSPQLQGVLDSLQPPPDDLEVAVASARRQVHEHPTVWNLRSQLAGLQIDQGKSALAAQTLLTYPGFATKHPDNGVYLSNIAAEAGHAFFWRGDVDQARQLYHVAVRYQTGSEAEMIAALHLRLMAGDFASALEQARLRAERYTNDLAYGNYLFLLHLTGHSKLAWQVFNNLLGRPMGPGLWESAMVGLRIDGTTPAQLDQWIDQPKITNAVSRSVSWPATFLLMWSTTDRQAVANLSERIQVLGREPRGLIEGTGDTASYPSTKADQRYLVTRSTFRSALRPAIKFGTAVESDEPLFAQALVPLQAGDYATAVARFDALAARFPIERQVSNADAVYALADFAYASAKSGDSLGLELFLNGLPQETGFFELSLSKAYFQAISHHDTAAALKNLDESFGWMSHVWGRTPAMEYQYADGAERLYRETGDKRFRDRALSWAHQFQQLQPWTAWAYTMEAELTDNVVVRRAALVKAMFLDRLSPRLNAMPEADLDFARTKLLQGNPFLKVKKGSEAGAKAASTAT